MNVDAWSPSTFSVVEGCMESNPVHFAWSRDLYRSAAVTFTVDACLRFLFGAAGSGWPARRRNHFKPLCTGHRPYRGTLKPSARLDRTNWHHGLPDGKPWMGRCRALQSEPANRKSRRGHGQIWVDNLENTLRRSRGAIGRYQAAPGAPLAAARVPRRPWTVPTTFPGAGRGLIRFG